MLTVLLIVLRLTSTRDFRPSALKMVHLYQLCVAFVIGATTVSAAPRRSRLSLAEDFMPQYFFRNINGNPDTYSFGYDISDPATGNIQYRNEERYPNGTVIGSYGFVDPTGTSQTYNYVADKNGYRITNKPPKRNQASYETYNPIGHPLPDSEESTITWTRPKKPNKKMNEDNINKPNIGPSSGYMNNAVFETLKYMIPY